MSSTLKTLKREVRRRRIRSKVKGTDERPRLAIFKSNRYIFAQLVNDATGKTIVSSNGKTAKAKTKTEQATAVGKEIASLALAKSIKKVVFDRGGYIYTGRIKAVADAAREGGLEF